MDMPNTISKLGEMRFYFQDIEQSWYGFLLQWKRSNKLSKGQILLLLLQTYLHLNLIYHRPQLKQVQNWMQ